MGYENISNIDIGTEDSADSAKIEENIDKIQMFVNTKFSREEIEEALSESHALKSFLQRADKEEIETFLSPFGEHMLSLGDLKLKLVANEEVISPIKVENRE